jgi:transcriptional regulator with XRE-family HTH domain
VKFAKMFLTNDTVSCIVVAGGDNMEISVAEKIRLIMKRQNMTMGDLATASGQTRQNLSNKMTRGNFTEKDIENLATALGCKAEIRFTLPDGSEI